MPSASRFSCGLLLLLSGCTALNLTSEANRTSPAEIDSEIKAYQSCRTIAEVDHRLDDLLKAPDGQQQAERLIQGWGKHGSWHDLTVVKFIWERSPPEMDGQKKHFDHRRLFDAAKSVLAKHSELACQVFWYHQWSNGVPDFAGMMHNLEPHWVCDYNANDWEKFRRVLAYAGVASGLPIEMSVGESAAQADFDNLPRNWLDQQALILGQRPCLRYDHELGRWVVDKDAKQANRYLTTEEQRASPRPTPLPNWDSDIISPRPIQKTTDEEEELKLIGIPE